MADDTEDNGYRTITVPGIGELEFPSSMSDADIATAIKKHPQYEMARAKAQDASYGDLFGIDKAISPVRNYLKKKVEDFTGVKSGTQGPGTINPQAMVGEILKGVPVAGAAIPQTDEMNRMETEHPGYAKTANITGNVAATLPMAYGIAAKTVPNVLAHAASQGGLTLGLNSADRLARTGKYGSEDFGDIIKHDVPWAVAAPVASKILSRAAMPWFPKGLQSADPSARPTVDSILYELRKDVNPRTIVSRAPKFEKPMTNKEASSMLDDLVHGHYQEKAAETLPRAKPIFGKLNDVPNWMQALFGAGTGVAVGRMLGIGDELGLGLGLQAPYTLKLLSDINYGRLAKSMGQGVNKAVRPTPENIARLVTLLGANRPNQEEIDQRE